MTWLKENWFKVGILITLLIAVFFVGYSLLFPQKISKHNIIFPSKYFYDTGEDGSDNGVVNVTGTLTGADVWNVDGSISGMTNNSTLINCVHQTMECTAYTVFQIADNQIADLDTPSVYPIISWSKYLIVATDSGVGCQKTTINIDRQNQTAEWVEEPFNQADIFCVNSASSTYKWTIEEPTWNTFQH